MKTIIENGVALVVRGGGSPQYSKVEYWDFPEKISFVAWVIYDGVKYVNKNFSEYIKGVENNA